jgi:hypothetical protein
MVGGTAATPVQDEDVRGAFLTSRPKEKPASSGETARPSRKRPKQTAAAKSSVKPPEKEGGTPVSSDKAGNPAGSSKPVNVPRLGLGVTLFARDSNGLAVRANPDRVFRKGDRIRVLLETNADGYLYIFNTTDDGPPVMIYPHADLDEGGNYLQAHVPFEIPMSAATEERLRWFAFDDVAGTEHLFFVFTREPLKEIPIEDELLAFCRESGSSCPFRPSAEVWAAVSKELQEPLKIDRAEQYGKAQTEVEQHATTRGLGLSKDDPQPSVVMMASSNRPTLVATLDLIHK